SLYILPLPPRSTLFPFTTLFRSCRSVRRRTSRPHLRRARDLQTHAHPRNRSPSPRAHRIERLTPSHPAQVGRSIRCARGLGERLDRKSTRLNSSHVEISYAVFCL